MEQVRPKGQVIGLQRRTVEIHHVMATMVVVCDCGSSTPILIPNFDKAGICKACKTKYVIARLAFKNEGELVSLDMDVAKWAGPVSAMPATDVPLVTATEQP